MIVFQSLGKGGQTSPKNQQEPRLSSRETTLRQMEFARGYRLM